MLTLCWMNESFTLRLFFFFFFANIFLSWRNIYICLTDFLVLQPSVRQQLAFLEPLFLCFPTLPLLLKPSGCREKPFIPTRPMPRTPTGPHSKWARVFPSEQPPAVLAFLPRAALGKQYLKFSYGLTWTACLKVILCYYGDVTRTHRTTVLRSPLQHGTFAAIVAAAQNHLPRMSPVFWREQVQQGEAVFLMQITAQHPQITSLHPPAPSPAQVLGELPALPTHSWHPRTEKAAQRGWSGFRGWGGGDGLWGPWPSWGAAAPAPRSHGAAAPEPPRSAHGSYPLARLARGPSPAGFGCGGAATQPSTTRRCPPRPRRRSRPESGGDGGRPPWRRAEAGTVAAAAPPAGPPAAVQAPGRHGGTASARRRPHARKERRGICPKAVEKGERRRGARPLGDYRDRPVRGG